MKIIKKNLKWLVASGILIGLASMVFLKIYLNQKVEVVDSTDDLLLQEEEKIEVKTSEEEVVPEKVYVDIKGAVVNPGVYEIEEGKKVIDVIGLAGGFTEVANTSMINLAKQVNNEMVIIIYTNEEVQKAQAENSLAKKIDQECVCPEVKNDGCLFQKEQSSNSSEKNEKNELPKEKINLNTATKDELETLPGVGASKAEAIIQYREEIGVFKNIEELKEVSGIGDALFEKVKDYITV